MGLTITLKFVRDKNLIKFPGMKLELRWETHHALLYMATGYALVEVGCRRIYMRDSGVCRTTVYPPLVLLFPPSTTPNKTFISPIGTEDIK